MSVARFGLRTRSGQVSELIQRIPADDLDALAFINAAGITDATQQNAIQQIVKDLKGYGIWTKMKAIYPFVGGTATTHKWNLKDPRDLDAAFRLVFNGGWTHSSTGAQPNGTTGYANTFLLPSTSFTNNNTHISFYSRTSTLANNSVLLGTSKNPSALPLLTIYSRSLTNEYFFDAYSYVNNRITVNSSLTTQALFINTRTSSTSFKVFRNNSQFGTTNTTTSSQDITTCDKSIFIGALNLDGTVGQYSTNQCAFSSIGDGLTDTEASNLYTIVQNFNTTLSRQV